MEPDLVLALVDVGTFLKASGYNFIAVTPDTHRRVLARKHVDADELGRRLLAERNKIRSALGAQWAKALLVSAGKWGFDYLCLVAALSAVGASPRPELVLLGLQRALELNASGPGSPS
mgnify:CR=1 FL=1